MNNIKKTSIKIVLLCFLVKKNLRRGRDSNPRYLAVCRLSKTVH